MQTETIVDDPRRLLDEARVISIPELAPLVLPFPFSSAQPSIPLSARPFSFPSRIHLLAFRDGRKESGAYIYFSRLSSGSRPRRILRNNTKIFPPVLPTCATFLFGASLLLQRVNVYARLQDVDRTHLYTSLRRVEGFTIGAVVLSSWPPSLLWYIARARDVVRSRFSSWRCCYTGEHILSYDKSSRNVKPQNSRVFLSFSLARYFSVVSSASSRVSLRRFRSNRPREKSSYGAVSLSVRIPLKISPENYAFCVRISRKFWADVFIKT